MLDWDISKSASERFDPFFFFKGGTDTWPPLMKALPLMDHRDANERKLERVDQEISPRTSSRVRKPLSTWRMTFM